MKLPKSLPKTGDSKTTLIIGVLIVIIVILIMFANLDNAQNEPVTSAEGVENEGGIDWKRWLAGALLVGVAIGWYLTRSEDKLTQYTVIKQAADDYYNYNKTYLSTLPTNVRVSRGGIGEYYVEFIKEIYTVLFVEGSGIQESYPGQTMIEVKRLRANDELSMTRAKAGITTKTQIDSMRALGTLPEEEENRG